MKHYFSTLAAILSAAVIVLIIRGCVEYLDQQARLEREIRANASPTPAVPPTTPAPAFVRVTLDTQVFGRDQRSATLKTGTRLRVLSADGPMLTVEHQGETYVIDAAITTPDK